MEKEKLEIGQHLYELVFWDGRERQMRQFTIAEIGKGRIKLRYYRFTLPTEKYGIEYFSTKQEAIIDSIKTHERIIAEGYYKRKKLDDYDKRELKKSVSSLKRYLARLPPPPKGRGFRRVS